MTPMTKDEVRRAIRTGRRSRTADARSAADAGIARQAASFLPDTATTVTSYLPMPTEPPVDALNAFLLERGHTVLVPRIVASDLEWVVWNADTPTRPGPMGIRDPLGPAVDLTDATTMFVPALAIDRQGMRIGQGSGYYDRALGAIPRHVDGGPLLVAVTFDDELLDGLPTEWNDIRMDAVITPTQALRFS